MSASKMWPLAKGFAKLWLPVNPAKSSFVPLPGGRPKPRRLQSDGMPSDLCPP